MVRKPAHQQMDRTNTQGQNDAFLLAGSNVFRGGMVGAITMCDPEDTSFYCQLTYFTGTIRMILQIVAFCVLVVVAYRYVRRQYFTTNDGKGKKSSKSKASGARSKFKNASVQYLGTKHPARKASRKVGSALRPAVASVANGTLKTGLQLATLGLLG